MTIHFYIRFHTVPGQDLFIRGSLPELGCNRPQEAVRMEYFNKDYWHLPLEVSGTGPINFTHKYSLRNADGSETLEGGKGREVDTGKLKLDSLQLIDTWNHSGEFENVFYTDPFQKILLRENETKHKVKTPRSFNHIFRVQAPLVKKNQVVCLLGDSMETGNWNQESPVLMSLEEGWWEARLQLPHESFPLQYKYGLYDIREKKFLHFEGGPNRHVQTDVEERRLTILHDGFLHVGNDTWKGTGVSVPVFSLRSKNSFGIGEFNDLKLLADWASRTGLKLIQILPVNDTSATLTWRDSYPYAAISAFALHPIYLNLESVAGKKYSALIKPLRKKQKQLNDLQEVDYEQVIKFKLSTLRELFAVQKEDFLKDEDFLEFFEDNRHWLVPYAAFCYLRDRNGTSDFTKWKLYSVYEKAAIEKYVSPRAKHYSEIALTYFIQYHLHLQLKDAVKYAHKHHVILKGDIPIGVYRYSCDAWMAPELYHMDQQAGAPPDAFAVKGQNWGFPTYNWDRMSQDGFEWWNQRFVQMSNYFDAFRIDHILGFFRIWSIPLHSVEGIMGRFVPAIPVYRQELNDRGIWLEDERLINPFITESVLWEMFGYKKELFYPFLEPQENQLFILKPEFETQRQVADYFDSREATDENNFIRQGLFDLISNIILFRDNDQSDAFHFRFGMDSTISYRYFDDHIKYWLKELYIDYFFRRQDNFWLKEAMKKLPALRNATNMLICGEDLGLVPASVPQAMKQLGILSLEIQRMPKVQGREFFHPGAAPYLSVVTPSTHDMSTIRGWWEEDPAATQRFYNMELGQWGEAPRHCPGWVNKAIVMQHIYSPAIWCIFQLQDLLGMDETLRREDPHSERINIPANSGHYWNYRVHMNLEDLLKEKEFNEELRNIVEAGGR